MDRIRSLFRNSSIRNKIIAMYIPLLILPLFIVGWISNYLFTQAIIEQTFINVQDDSSLIVTRINNLLSNAESCANNIVKDINGRDIRLLLNRNETGGSYNLEKSARINYILNFVLVIFPDVESIAFIDNQNVLYTTSNNLGLNFNQALSSDLIKSVAASNGVNLWQPMGKRDFLVEDSNAAVLTLGKKVLDIDGGNTLGLLILNIKESDISSIYDKLETSKGGVYLIADDTDRIVSCKNKGDLFGQINSQLAYAIDGGLVINQKTVMIDGQQMLITSMPIEKINWTLMNSMNVLKLTSKTRRLSFIILWIGVICLVAAILGASLLSRGISKPIVKLTKKMKNVRDGSLDVHYDVNSTDEIGMLATGFNSMLESIRTLLEKVNAEQKKKREYELALIQSQIKPHFLYNALDLIYIFCSMGRNVDAQNTTKNLADFYRIALSQGNEIITLEEELKNVEKYLQIQQVRYSDVFDYVIKSDPSILSYTIPKLTIQPLVENSIYHGLKLKGSYGKLLIEASAENEDIIVSIMDDGIGMDAEKLQGILAASEGPKESFGLRSVDERIKLYFGEEYGLTLESTVGIGTSVTVKIPKNRRVG